MTTFGAVLRVWFSGALLGSDGVERGPTLFDFLTATAGADRFTLFIFRKTQDFGEDFLTGVAVKLVVGHWGLRAVVKGSS
jgi:hypothetical protein